MYLVENMIELGLLEGQKFPTKAHKKVAQAIALCNPNVRNRDTLTDIVQAVLKVPTAKIKTIPYEKLVDKYGCPHVC